MTPVVSELASDVVAAMGAAWDDGAGVVVRVVAIADAMTPFCGGANL